jgi:hypothetical protein
VKQINPLYIALLFVVVLAVVILKLSDANSTHNASVAALQETEVTARRIVALQKDWDRGEQSTAPLDRLLNSAPLQGTELVKKRKRNRVMITAASINKQAADYLLNKLLNNTYVIKALEIRRLNAQQASLYVEVIL